MKINDMEKQLGITKANIRFYEKEGLISPNRSENGYRDYSDSDVTRLKEIIILRKLGIPVQQIADIQDGALPLQEALDSNIKSLQAEIEKLNGSLALCKQLKQEDARMLDTERYWEIIQEKELQGFRFQTLWDDYLKFTEIGYEWLLWPLPIDSLRSPWKLAVYILVLSAIWALSFALSGQNFLVAFVRQIFYSLRTIVIWTAIFVPLFFLSKKKPKLAHRIMIALLIAVAVATIVIFSICLFPVILYNVQATP